MTDSKALILEARELKEANKGFSKLVGKSSLPVLNMLRFTSAADGKVEITGTDLDVFATYRMASIGGCQAVDFLVPYEPFAKALKMTHGNAPMVIAPQDGDKVLLAYNNGGLITQTVQSMPVTEFCPIPALKGEPIKSLTLDAKSKAALKKAVEVCSEDATRFVIQHPLITKQYIVATDGRRLFCQNSFAFEMAKEPQNQEMILTNVPILFRDPMYDDGDWQVAEHQSPDNLKVTSSHWTLVIKTVDGNYPNFKQVIPDNDGEIEIAFDDVTAERVASAAPRLPGGKNANSVKLEFVGQALTMTGGGESGAKLEIKGGITKNGKDGAVALNPEYFALSLKFGMRKMFIKDELSAVVFKDDTGGKMVVMPMRMS